MKIIIRPIMGGKTYQAIQQAAETGSCMVVLNEKEASRVAKTAREMGVKINFPLTFDNLIQGEFHAPGIRGIIIDNADELLKQLFKVKIEAITITGTNNDTPNPHLDGLQEFLGKDRI